MLTLVAALLGVAAVASIRWQLHHLDVERVPNDVAHAIDAGDLRLLAIEGQGLYLPGVDEALYARATEGHCGIRVIFVGDAFQWGWEYRLYRASFGYAEAFNRRLVSQVTRGRLCDPAV